MILAFWEQLKKTGNSETVMAQANCVWTVVQRGCPYPDPHISLISAYILFLGFSTMEAVKFNLTLQQPLVVKTVSSKVKRCTRHPMLLFLGECCRVLSSVFIHTSLFLNISFQIPTAPTCLPTLED